MKLKAITEAPITDPSQVLGALGIAAQKLFGNGRKKLPDRLTRKRKDEVDESNTSHQTVDGGTDAAFSGDLEIPDNGETVDEC